MKVYTGHLYRACPFVQNLFCTYCKNKGHKAEDCVKAGCRRAAKAADGDKQPRHGPAQDPVPDYDSNAPGAGYDPPVEADEELAEDDLGNLGEEEAEEIFQH